MSIFTHFTHKLHKLKTNLDRFETVIDEKLFLEGEALYDSGAVIKVEKKDNKLFSALVEEKGKILEVEWYRPAALNRKATCDCKGFSQAKYCKHIVAALLAIRNTIQKSKKKDSPKPKMAKKSQAYMSPSNLLLGVTEEEIKTFTKQYARKDRYFDLYLKAVFAKKVDIENNEEKYKKILDSLIPPAKSQDYKISLLTIRKTMDFLEEFKTQIEDSLALKQYKEASEILFPTLKKISYIIHYSSSPSDKLDQYNIDFHNIVKNLFHSNAAPELKDRIKEFTLSLAAYSYYHIRHFQYNAISILHDNSSSTKSELLEIIKTKLKKDVSPIHFSLYLLVASKSILKKELLQYFNQMSLIVGALEIMISYEKYEEAEKVFKVIDSLKWKDGLIDDLKLRLLIHKKEYDQLIKSGVKRLCITNRISYYKLIKSSIPTNFTKQLIEEVIKNKKHFTSDLYCRILKSEKEDLKLIEYLEECNDLDLAISHDSMLYESQYERLENFYLNATRLYLSSHVGEKSEEYIASILFHLRRRRALKMISNIKKDIKLNFPHRKRFLASYQ